MGNKKQFPKMNFWNTLINLPMPKKRLLAYSLLILTSAIWGIAGPVIKHTLQFIPPFTFLFWRFLLSSLIFLPSFFVLVKKEKENLKTLLPIIPLGFLGIPLCLTFIFLGFERTTALDGSILSSLAPIFIVLAGVLFLKENVSKIELLGLTITISGLIVMVSQPLLEEGGFNPKNILGNILIVISNIVWTAYVIFSKIEFKKHSPFIITAVSFFTGVIAIFPLALIEQLTIIDWQKSVYLSPQPLFYINPKGLEGLLYMTFLSSAVAYFAFETGLRLIEASEATLFAYLQPIFAMPVAIFWLKEKITLPFIIGAIIITFGVFLSEFYRPKLNRLRNI